MSVCEAVGQAYLRNIPLSDTPVPEKWQPAAERTFYKIFKQYLKRRVFVCYLVPKFASNFPLHRSWTAANGETSEPSAGNS